MGYYIEQRGGFVEIPADKVAEAEAAVRKVVGEHPHLSWVTQKDALATTTFKALMEECRWELVTDESTGNVIDLYFRGEKSGGDEDIVLRALAPFVKSGCYIEMQGEGGERWRWVFEGGDFDEIHADVTFGDRRQQITREALRSAIDFIQNGEGDKDAVTSLISKALSI